MRFVFFQRDFFKRLFIDPLVNVTVLCIPRTAVMWDEMFL